MGSKYNWKFLNYWVEYTPQIYIRIKKNTPEGWKQIYTKWRG